MSGKQSYWACCSYTQTSELENKMYARRRCTGNVFTSRTYIIYFMLIFVLIMSIVNGKDA